MTVLDERRVERRLAGLGLAEFAAGFRHCRAFGALLTMSESILAGAVDEAVGVGWVVTGSIWGPDGTGSGLAARARGLVGGVAGSALVAGGGPVCTLVWGRGECAPALDPPSASVRC